MFRAIAALNSGVGSRTNSITKLCIFRGMEENNKNIIQEYRGDVDSDHGRYDDLEQEVIIGANMEGHDGSCCIIQRGKILAFMEDERVSRIRHSTGRDCITWCTDYAGIPLSDIKYRVPLTHIPNSDNHHAQHAWNGYSQSGYRDASILVIDGISSNNHVSITIFEARNNVLTLYKSFLDNYSLGNLYESCSEYCGFGPFGQGKVMGLAPYGKIQKIDFPIIFNDGDMHGIFEKQAGERTNMVTLFSEWANNNLYPYDSCKTFDFRYADIAATVQHIFEVNALNMCEFMAKTLHSKNLIIEGGCALNCTANGKIIRSKLFDNVFISTNCSDNGIAVGSVLFPNGTKLNEPLVYNTKTYDIPEGYKKVSKEYIANLIRQDKIIAWFEGGSEYGPRALGHRSLLADPSTRKMNYRMNEIKHREYWRPLAPIVLDTVFTKVFEQDRIWQPHTVMLATEVIRENWRDKIPAVCAVDNTARPQALSDNKYNHTLYTLMRDYDLPVLINTSMNDKGEPIVETPEQAITFAKKNNDVVSAFVQDDDIYIPN
jgi:carbamoyltransferase